MSPITGASRSSPAAARQGRKYVMATVLGDEDDEKVKSRIGAVNLAMAVCAGGVLSGLVNPIRRCSLPSMVQVVIETDQD